MSKERGDLLKDQKEANSDPMLRNSPFQVPPSLHIEKIGCESPVLLPHQRRGWKTRAGHEDDGVLIIADEIKKYSKESQLQTQQWLSNSAMLKSKDRPPDLLEDLSVDEKAISPLNKETKYGATNIETSL